MTIENINGKNMPAYRKLVRRAGATIICAALMAGTSSFAYAQQAEEAEMIASLEEIIVTARKRSESIQETPIAITALSTAQLEKRSLTNLMEIGAYIPNVVMNSSPSTSGGGNNSQIYIRGIGQSDFLFTTDPGVGIYVDGVYHPRTLGGVMDLLDLERVEVLRGPQGTLFGKNTIGGAIALTSQKPMGDGTGYLEVTTGRFDRLDIRGSFDVALSDTLAAKVSMSSKNRDGIGRRLEYGTDKVLDTAGDENATSARVALRWEASPDVTIDFTADYTREREKGVPSILVFVDDNGAALGGLGGLWNILVGGPAGLPYTSDFIIGGDNRYDSYATDGNRNTLDSYGFSMDIDWAVNENLSFRSITAYREMEAFFNSDTDGSPLSFVTTDQAQDQNQVSQEFQLIGTSFDDKLDWVVGVFYFDEFGRDDNVVRLASGLYDALEALPGTLDGSPLTAPTAAGGPGNPINPNFDLDLNIFNEIDIKSYAAFTQGTYQVSDKISVTAGARYSYEKKDYFLNHTRENSGAVIIGNRTISENWSSFTPMGSIDYKINEDALIYISVTQGFKSGGFNGRPISVSAVDSFDPETVLSYEFGFKTDWFDNRLRLNGAVFNANYTDMQLGSISADENGVLALRIQNAGKAKIQGFELELQARPTANLDIIGSLGYVDFEITQLDAGVQDFNLNTRAMKTPEWNFSLGAEYTVEIDSSSEISLRGDWTYQSETEQNVQNTDLIRAPGYGLLNTRLTYSNLDNDWEIALFVTNLTDKTYVSSGFQTLTSFGTANLIYGRPREWGLTVKKRF
ncbi:TonB-dependent receptor [hydrothermal vent metagenome]|uniref:TonB-dependent receptor n=1 Tax=hydrothermal vent metagenome TaxID=652676 RepID=A0A3B1AG34_9ZZZZ